MTTCCLDDILSLMDDIIRAKLFCPTSLQKYRLHTVRYVNSVISAIKTIITLDVYLYIRHNGLMSDPKVQLSLRVPKDFKQRLRIASIKAEREMTDIAIEAINLWLIDFYKKEETRQ